MDNFFKDGNKIKRRERKKRKIMNQNFKHDNHDTKLFERRLNISNNLHYNIHEYDDICFDINPHLYISSIEFFLCKHLSQFKRDSIPPIYFYLYNNQVQSQGSFYADGEGAFIFISDKNIKKQCDEGMCINNYLDSFFITLLHEIAHLKQYIKCMEMNNINDENFIEFHEFYFHNNKNNPFNQYMNKKYIIDDKMCSSIFSDNEAEAEYFAYENLSVFKNIYSNRGYFHSTIFCMLEEKKEN